MYVNVLSFSVPLLNPDGARVPSPQTLDVPRRLHVGIPAAAERSIKYLYVNVLSFSVPLLNPDGARVPSPPTLDVPRRLQVGKPPVSKQTNVVGKILLLVFIVESLFLTFGSREYGSGSNTDPTLEKYDQPLFLCFFFCFSSTKLN